MKVCFISMNLFSYGGVQRVLSRILTELNKQTEIEVNLIMPMSESDTNIFGLDESIRIINYFDFKLDDRTLWGFICKAIRRFNKDTGILENKAGRKISEHVYFPGAEKKKLEAFLSKEKYDIVVGVGDLFAVLLGTIRERLSCKCIGWMHSTFDSYFREKGDQCYGLLGFSKIQFQKLDYVMALTDKDVEDFQKEFGVKAIKLPNPVNYFCEAPARDISAPIIFVGRMMKNHKGLDYLVEIIDKYHQLEPKRRFVILGDGPDKDWFDREIQKRKLEEVVDTFGSVRNVEDYLQSSSLLLHTSRWEGFGVVIVEAMMYGLPVVAFHNNGPDEIITEGEEGCLIDRFDCDRFAEKMREILSDHTIYSRMSECANRTAKNFTPDKVTKELISIMNNH